MFPEISQVYLQAVKIDFALIYKSKIVQIEIL